MNNIDVEKIKSIKFSLLKKETEIIDNSAEYSKKVTVKFVIPKNFFEIGYEEFMLKELISHMYDDLKNNAPEKADSLGLWIEYDTLTLDNAISLKTLDDIEMYSTNNSNAIYEFFLMTLPK